ncbi:MAG TPA: choice-of-anchor B family protein [Acidobacteriota bacterium]
MPRPIRNRWGCLLLGLGLAGALTAHDDPLGKENDQQPPYAGPGHSGAPIDPGGSGYVLDFPASGISLLSWVSVPEMDPGAPGANDIWGHVSPTGREYAIVGLQRGTAFVEVTDPLRPKLVKTIADPLSLWSDMKSYGSYAYNVNESRGGLQVIDLGAIDQGRVRLVGELTEAGLQTSHNVAINEASGFLYLCGANIHNGGLVAVDLADPARPHLAGSWPNAYVHDAQVVNYDQGRYAGREIVFAFTGSLGLTILDATDKSDIFELSNLRYPNVSYCHQGWLSDDRRFLFVDDEGDEVRGLVATTTTYVIDVRDLEQPRLAATFTSGRPSIDHNLMVRGPFVFEANYRSGLRVFDAAKLAQVHEAAYFDTYPDDDLPSFNGAWGVYTGLPSGVILVSDMQRGLFVLGFDAELALQRIKPGRVAAGSARNLKLSGSGFAAGLTAVVLKDGRPDPDIELDPIQLESSTRAWLRIEVASSAAAGKRGLELRRRFGAPLRIDDAFSIGG